MNFSSQNVKKIYYASKASYEFSILFTYSFYVFCLSRRKISLFEQGLVTHELLAALFTPAKMLSAV